jgi:hypothetical protein
MMEDRELAFHGLAIKRHASPEAVAGLMGMSVDHAAGILATAVTGGRAIETKGGYALTPLARLSLEARYALHFSNLRDNADFVSAYEAFERVNKTLKQVITDWQTLDIGGVRTSNDHSNKAHDEAIIDRLGQVHETVEPLLDKLSQHLPRLAIYSKKLLQALEAAEDGEIDWVSDIRRESYHTVWFELHEDLLRIMGCEREE